MKNITLIGLVLILCYIGCQAQGLDSIQNSERSFMVDSLKSADKIKNKYSQNNLSQSTLEDLNQYLRKSKKMKTTGLIIAIAGLSACTAGAYIGTEAYVETIGGTIEGNLTEETTDKFSTGAILIVGGLATTVVGSTIQVIGNSRVKHIKKAINTHTGASLYLSPGFVCENKTENFYPGITLRVKF